MTALRPKLGRFALAGLVVLIGVSCAARADMYPDASNAKLPEARTNMAVAPHVTTNAGLVGASTMSYPKGVWRDDFAAGNGASLQWYVPGGSACPLADNGAQVASSDGKCWLAVFPAGGADVRQWGVRFDNATDNTTALQAAFAWAAKGNRLVLPPAPLSANFATPISVTFATASASLTLTGGGPDQTMLSYTGASGNAITVNYFTTSGKLNHVHFRDFSLCTTHTGGATGFNLSQTAAGTTGQIAGSDFTHVTLRGCDGYAQTDYWGTAINVAGPSEFTYFDLRIEAPASIAGIGVNIVGTAGMYSFQHNFVASTMNNLALAIQAGINVQGLTITAGSNFTNVVKALQVTTGQGTDQFTIADSQFECSGICIVTGGGSDFFIHHNYFILNANNAIGINVVGSNGLTADHNLYRNAGGFTQLVAELIVGPFLSPIHISNNAYLNLQYSHYYAAGSYAYQDFITDNVYSGGSGIIIPAGSTALTDISQALATVTPCSAALADRVQLIGDASAPTWGQPVTAGGVGYIKAFCNGTNWTVFSR